MRMVTVIYSVCGSYSRARNFYSSVGRLGGGVVLVAEELPLQGGASRYEI